MANEKKCDKAGRNVRELALVHLPPCLSEKHCNDLTAGKSHAESSVVEVLKREYSVAELVAMDLWNPIQSRISG